MRVQIERNWTDIVGEIIDIRPSSKYEDTTEIVIAVRETKSVEGYRCFYCTGVGRELTVNFKNKSLAGLDPVIGGRIEARIRKTPIPGVIFANTRKIAINSP